MRECRETDQQMSVNTVGTQEGADFLVIMTHELAHVH